MKVGTEETLTCFDTHASQDEVSYDGNVSDAEEDDMEVVPDEVDDTQVESSKPVRASSATERKFERLSTRAVAAKHQSLWTRIQMVNWATRLPLGQGMGLSSMIKASLLRDAGTNIQKTTF